MEKFERSERNYLIAVLKLAGEPIAVIAGRFGISVQHASNVARANAWMVKARAGRAVPAGLTTRAAVAIEQALGIWPSDTNKALVEGSAMTMFRAENGRRVIMEDIGRWLEFHAQQMAATRMIDSSTSKNIMRTPSTDRVLHDEKKRSSFR